MFTEAPARPVRRGLGRALGTLDLLLGPHGVDRWVELVAPTFSTHEVRGRVVEVRHETTDSVTLTIAPNGNWTGFEAGQHVLVTVPVDGVHHTRCYSMRSSAHDRSGRFELTVKAHPGGIVSNHLVRHAVVGTVLGLSPAQGDFTLPTPRPDRLLLISGGSGITPVLSMLRTLCDEGHAGPITFLHYCLTRTDQVARTELDALAAAHPNVRVQRVFTDEPGRGDHDGFFSPEQLAAVEPDWRDATAFVCGPAPLMDAVVGHYEAAGLAERVHHEAFTLPSLVVEAGAAGGTIVFERSGCSAAADGRPLLEQAEDAGLAPAHGCRMGICHTCTRTLRAGTVRDLVTGQVTTGPDVPVRICVNAPVGDVAVDL